MNKNFYTIRTVRVTDIPFLPEFFKTVADEPLQHVSDALWRAFIDALPDTFLAAEDTNTSTLIGLCLCIPYKITATIFMIFVLPQYRQKGVGVSLLERICRTVHGIGCDDVLLYIPPERTDAIKWAERNLFTLAEHLPDYLCSDPPVPMLLYTRSIATCS